MRSVPFILSVSVIVIAVTLQATSTTDFFAFTSMLVGVLLSLAGGVLLNIRRTGIGSGYVGAALVVSSFGIINSAPASVLTPGLFFLIVLLVTFTTTTGVMIANIARSGAGIPAPAGAALVLGIATGIITMIGVANSVAFAIAPGKTAPSALSGVLILSLTIFVIETMALYFLVKKREEHLEAGS